VAQRYEGTGLVLLRGGATLRKTQRYGGTGFKALASKIEAKKNPAEAG